jgi:hypothetical protein
MILQEHDRYRFMPHVFSGDRYHPRHRYAENKRHTEE